jgi:hypothetical protein
MHSLGLLLLKILRVDEVTVKNTGLLFFDVAGKLGFVTAVIALPLMILLDKFIAIGWGLLIATSAMTFAEWRGAKRRIYPLSSFQVLGNKALFPFLFVVALLFAVITVNGEFHSWKEVIGPFLTAAGSIYALLHAVRTPSSEE